MKNLKATFTALSWLATASISHAFTFTTLTTFSSTAGGPQFTTALVQAADGNFYGTTVGGSASPHTNDGTVFKLTPSGTLTTFATFSPTGSNGNIPDSPLVQYTDGSFYGTAGQGGSRGFGTIFQVSPTGTMTTLVNFIGTNGYNPTGLILGKDKNFYGVTSGDGVHSYGTIFQMTPAGVLTTLFTFNLNRSNGANPLGLLAQGSDGSFYGVTSSNPGSVFKLAPDGTFSTLTTLSSSAPVAGLIFGSNGNLFGGTQLGGSDDGGFIFTVTTSGMLTTVASLTNSFGGGSGVLTPLLQATDGNLYGSTGNLLFEVEPLGGVNLYNFTTGTGGGIIQGNDGYLYGVTGGSVYRVDIGATENISFSSATTVPITSADYTISGTALDLNLAFSPTVGTVLTLIQMTGSTPINGTYTNLPNGGSISTIFNGNSYNFVASYSGGTSPSVIKGSSTGPSLNSVTPNASGTSNNLTLTLVSITPLPLATDSPLLPQWAWLLMIAGTFVAGCRMAQSTLSRQST